MNMLRLFWGIPVDLSVIAQVYQRLKAEVPATFIQWSEPEDLHITLHFMPAFPADKLERLLELSQKYMANLLSFPLQIKMLSLFPEACHPRFLAFELSQTPDLITLVKCLGNALEQNGEPVDDTRSFRPHITLGKVKDTAGMIKLPSAVLNLQAPVEVPVCKVRLYESRPQASRSRYLARAEFDLQANK